MSLNHSIELNKHYPLSGLQVTTPFLASWQGCVQKCVILEGAALDLKHLTACNLPKLLDNLLLRSFIFISMMQVISTVDTTLKSLDTECAERAVSVSHKHTRKTQSIALILPKKRGKKVPPMSFPDYIQYNITKKFRHFVLFL